METTAFDRVYSTMDGILHAMHGQLQFAEAKNGALLAANLATVVGIGAITAQASSIAHSLAGCLAMGCFGLAGAGLIALTSFLPIMGRERHIYARGEGADGANLVFWEEIAKFTPDRYAAALIASLGVEDKPGRLHLDIAEQIVINAGIARRKFARFELAAWITFGSAVVPTIILAGLWIGAGFKFP